MVGTRKMTNYGKMAAYELAKELAVCGAVIVSGMANGIDSASHKGCLIAGGFTIAVFGCGIDRVYPPDNKILMEKIIEKGLAVTEYAPGSEPKGAHFPVRNRIISGLCQAVLVVEADNRSGALITAKTALFQGRELYAVPGNITSPNSRGTNGLLKNQAGMVTEAYDILSEYEHLYSHRINIEKSRYYNNKINYYKSREDNGKKSKEKYSLGNGNVSSTVGNSVVNKMANKIKESASDVSDIKSDIKDVKTDVKAEITVSEKLSALKIILNETELKVFEIFYARKDEKLNPDNISGENLPISDVINTLTFLEIYGIITSLPGDYYRISDSFMNL
jgi:DNA protecting protein DprA